MSVGDRVELISPALLPISFVAGEIIDANGAYIDSTPRAMMPFKMRIPQKAEKYSLIRRIR